ncbi:chemotaxis protein CheX [Eubacteriaceae bacterium ES3]|nr:chemotaxis protein CheX [Eubacteriaceae bacterium ES3]
MTEMPFLNATKNVFELMLDLLDITDHPGEDFFSEHELDIAVGVIGDLEGVVIYRFPHQTSLEIVKIMSSMEFDKVDDFVISAMSELSNIISGNVLTILSGENLTCDILPPKLGIPEKEQDYELETASCLATPAGNICIETRLNRSH